MKGYRIVWPATQKATLEEWEFPDACPPGHVLLETEYTLISPGTEKAGFLGLPNTGGAFPRYPGYSAVGRILELGDGISDLRVGDRVVAYHSKHASLSIKARRDVVKVENEALDSQVAVFSIIAAMSLQGVRKLRLELGESSMVAGLGLLGLFATQFAHLSGALPVIAMDFSEARRKLALKLGADHAFSPDDENLISKIKEITGGGVNALAEITGASSALQQLFACMAPQGRVALIGCSRSPAVEVDFYNDVHKPGITIIGAHNFVRPSEDSYPGYWTMRDDLAMILRFFASGRLHASEMIAEIAAPEQAEVVYGNLAQGEFNPPGILFDWRTINKR